MSEYQNFLGKKLRSHIGTGIEPSPMPDWMKPHQIDATAFALRAGRAGNFLDTGLGKTVCELEYARQASEEVNSRALILTPLAVAKQIKREANKFGYEAKVIRDQSEASDGINICNYDRLEKLDPTEFGVIILDESSILKSFVGSTSRSIRDAFSNHRFRLSATATPAPNDHMELGQQSEFLGVMNSVEMLSKFFINDTSTASQNWRLKGHAEQTFWDWMASWAVMAESPADFGHDASEYFLPPLEIIRHQVGGNIDLPKDGLFAAEASATNIFEIKRATGVVRADEIARIVHAEREPWVVWCDTNQEADALVSRIPDAVEVRGSMSIEAKEDALEAFALGQARVIITKPSIAGFGVNWQHCRRMAFIGRNFSYETWYQAVRRCYRFGQKHPVHVHLAVAEGEEQIGRVIDRKSADHIRMKRMMGAAMRADTTGEKLAALNDLFNQCFRIQKEASFAVGRIIPLVVENVRGAQPWVGRARWNFGSFYLWGDVPALMPTTLKASKVPGFRFDGSGRSFQTASVEGVKAGDAGWRKTGPGRQLQDHAIKVHSLNWSNYGKPDYKPKGFNVTAAQRYREEAGIKNGGDWFGSGEDQSLQRHYSGTKQPGIGGRRANGKGDAWFQDGAAAHGSKSDSCKAASAMIAKIPLTLSRHIAGMFRP